eukprot:6187347-Pleurochrysis_carterae.AAC.2
MAEMASSMAEMAPTVAEAVDGDETYILEPVTLDDDDDDDFEYKEVEVDEVDEEECPPSRAERPTHACMLAQSAATYARLQTHAFRAITTLRG